MRGKEGPGMVEYKGYTIEHDRGHYLVTGPQGQWTEDTVQDAKAQIDELEEETEELTEVLK